MSVVVGLAGVLGVSLTGSGCGAATTIAPARAVIPGAVTLTLTSPTTGSVVGADHVTVRGTVSPANAAVQIQGQPAAVGDGVFTGMATLHGGTTTIDVIGSAPGAAPSSTSIAVTRRSAGHTSAVIRTLSSGTTPSVAYAGSGSGETSCGGGLAVGPNTTCAFAENVQSAYDSAGPGTVVAYSPVTNRTYAMSCSAGTPVVCTGADNASVYLPGSSTGETDATTRSSSSGSTPAIAYADSRSGETSCGGGLAVGPNTTCAFAENVQSAYDSAGPGTVTAYSPVTNRTYAMSCSAGIPVVCTGANNASVYFP